MSCYSFSLYFPTSVSPLPVIQLTPHTTARRHQAKYPHWTSERIVKVHHSSYIQPVQRVYKAIHPSQITIFLGNSTPLLNHNSQFPLEIRIKITMIINRRFGCLIDSLSQEWTDQDLKKEDILKFEILHFHFFSCFPLFIFLVQAMPFSGIFSTD